MAAAPASVASGGAAASTSPPDPSPWGRKGLWDHLPQCRDDVLRERLLLERAIQVHFRHYSQFQLNTILYNRILRLFDEGIPPSSLKWSDRPYAKATWRKLTALGQPESYHPSALLAHSYIMNREALEYHIRLATPEHEPLVLSIDGASLKMQGRIGGGPAFSIHSDSVTQLAARGAWSEKKRDIFSAGFVLSSETGSSSRRLLLVSGILPAIRRLGRTCSFASDWKDIKLLLACGSGACPYCGHLKAFAQLAYSMRTILTKRDPGEHIGLAPFLEVLLAMSGGNRPLALLRVVPGYLHTLSTVATRLLKANGLWAHVKVAVSDSKKATKMFGPGGTGLSINGLTFLCRTPAPFLPAAFIEGPWADVVFLFTTRHAGDGSRHYDAVRRIHGSFAARGARSLWSLGCHVLLHVIESAVLLHAGNLAPLSEQGLERANGALQRYTAAHGGDVAAALRSMNWSMRLMREGVWTKDGKVECSEELYFAPV